MKTSRTRGTALTLARGDATMQLQWTCGQLVSQTVGQVVSYTAVIRTGRENAGLFRLDYMRHGDDEHAADT